MTRRLHVLIILLALLAITTGIARGSSHPRVSPSDTGYEKIDAYLQSRLKALRIPGASLVIVEGDRIVHTRGFGTTGPGGNAPTPQTPYFIGSVSKSFTALAVMQLVEAGKIELDAPVQRYLPWFTLTDAEAARRITVRHLLNQTSGLSQVGGMKALADFDSTPGAAERQARALAAFTPTRPAGAEFEYSNLNFNLAGLVVEAASGESYAGYVENHIFAPLEMQHSFAQKSDARKDGLAVGHRMWFGLPFAEPDLPVPEGSLASGQWIASAEDMGHYLVAQLNQGRYQDARILSGEGIEELHRPAAVVKMGEEVMGDYGMGWFIIRNGDEKMVFHDGEVPDYFAYMAVLPEHKRGMALLVNANQQVYNYALWALSENATWMLAGLPPREDAWNILPWLSPCILLIPIIQGVSIAAGIRRIKKWRVDPDSRPGRRSLWLLHILLPGLVDLAMAAIPAALLASGMYLFLYLFLGDIVSVLTLCGAAALAWLFARTLFVLLILKTRPSSMQ